MYSFSLGLCVDRQHERSRLLIFFSPLFFFLSASRFENFHRLVTHQRAANYSFYIGLRSSPHSAGSVENDLIRSTLAPTPFQRRYRATYRRTLCIRRSSLVLDMLEYLSSPLSCHFQSGCASTSNKPIWRWDQILLGDESDEDFNSLRWDRHMFPTLIKSF